MNVLTATGLTKRFRTQPVLTGLDLDLTPGQVTVLLGPNGAGKSTLCRLALGQLRPGAGSIRVHGVDPVRASKTVLRNTGYVPDRPDVYRWMTIRDLCRFLAPQFPTWDQSHAEEVIDLLEVPRRTPFRNLSKGQGMKAMLVAALAHRPALLILDEPFAGLDPVAREDVLRGVIAALRDERRTVLCSTHDLEIAARIADRVAVLADGRIRQHGDLEEFLSPGEGDAPAGVPARIRSVLAGAARREGESCAR